MRFASRLVVLLEVHGRMRAEIMHHRTTFALWSRHMRVAGGNDWNVREDVMNITAVCTA